jgi:hypothetical protein
VNDEEAWGVSAEKDSMLWAVTVPGIADALEHACIEAISLGEVRTVTVPRSASGIEPGVPGLARLQTLVNQTTQWRDALGYVVGEGDAWVIVVSPRGEGSSDE